MGAKFDPLLGQLRTTDASGGGSGTVTSVSSADGNITVATGTTTPVLTSVAAPKLATARNINGVAFDGTASITVPAAAGTLTGTTLASGITASSLTTLGSNASLPGSPTTTTQSPSDNSTKIATTAYTDLAVAAAVQGLSIKQSVQEATAAALPTNTYLAGVITITATGVLTVDGVAVALNDRVLVKNEVTQANNGIYLCTTAGAIGVAAVLTRATDSNTSAGILGGFTFVETGTTNADAGFVNTNTTTITIGTTPITYTQFSGAGEITAGNGITKTGNTLAIDTTVVVDTLSTQASIGGAKTFTSNASFSSGTVSLTNATSNIINMGSPGAGAPAFTTRSAGARLVLFPNETGSTVDASIGIQSNAMWYATFGASSTFSHLWYGGTTQVMKLDGTGVLTLVGQLTAPAGAKITPRVNTVASSGTPAINTDTTDLFTVTALVANITSFTSGLTGTPQNGQKLLVRIKGAGAQTVAWGASFGASGSASLLGTTVAGKTHLSSFVYDSAAALWVCMASDLNGY